MRISKCSYIRGEKVIETSQGKFVITPKCNDKNKIFDYLEKRDFPFFLPMNKNSDESYEVYPYVTDSMSSSDKAMDLVHILSLLHIKTTSFQEVKLDAIKEMYEHLLAEIEDFDQYYHQLQDEFESHIYMAPDEYLLIRNISLLYENLYLCRKYLEDWYQKKKNISRERIVLLHKQPCLSYFIDLKTPYFTHWDLSEKGYPIYDFLFFYKKDYLAVEMSSLFQIYQSKFQYTEDEMDLFFCLLLLDDKISFSDDYYQNTILVHQHILYSFHVKEFILKQNQKNQETNENKFN